MTSEPGMDVLSAGGTARREAILAAVLRAQRARVRQRRALRGTGSLLLLGLGAGVVYAALSRTPPPAPPAPGDRVARGAPEVRHGAAAAAPSWVVEVDESILSRVSVTDDELGRLLRQAGKSDGIIRVGGRAMLESDVTPRPSDGGA